MDRAHDDGSDGRNRRDADHDDGGGANLAQGLLLDAVQVALVVEPGDGAESTLGRAGVFLKSFLDARRQQLAVGVGHRIGRDGRVDAGGDGVGERAHRARVVKLEAGLRLRVGGHDEGAENLADHAHRIVGTQEFPADLAGGHRAVVEAARLVEEDLGGTSRFRAGDLRRTQLDGPHGSGRKRVRRHQIVGDVVVLDTRRHRRPVDLREVRVEVFDQRVDPGVVGLELGELILEFFGVCHLWSG